MSETSTLRTMIPNGNLGAALKLIGLISVAGGGGAMIRGAVAPAEAHAVQQASTNVSDQLSAQATALAVLQAEMRGLRADLSEMKADVKAMRGKR